MSIFDIGKKEQIKAYKANRDANNKKLYGKAKIDDEPAEELNDTADGVDALDDYHDDVIDVDDADIDVEESDDVVDEPGDAITDGQAVEPPEADIQAPTPVPYYKPIRYKAPAASGPAPLRNGVKITGLTLLSTNGDIIEAQIASDGTVVFESGEKEEFAIGTMLPVGKNGEQQFVSLDELLPDPDSRPKDYSIKWGGEKNSRALILYRNGSTHQIEERFMPRADLVVAINSETGKVVRVAHELGLDERVYYTEHPDELPRGRDLDEAALADGYRISHISFIDPADETLLNRQVAAQVHGNVLRLDRYLGLELAVAVRKPKPAGGGLVRLDELRYPHHLDEQKETLTVHYPLGRTREDFLAKCYRFSDFVYFWVDEKTGEFVYEANDASSARKQTALDAACAKLMNQ